MTQRILPILALLLAGTASATCSLKRMPIPVRVVDHRAIANVTLDGVDVPMLVDSGAFFSMLSASTAARLKLPLHELPTGLRVQGYTGRVDARATTVKVLGLPGAELTDMEFMVGGSELDGGIMGVLGRNILAAADTEYDLGHGMLRISIPQGDDCDGMNFAYWAQGAPVVVAPLDYLRGGSDSSIRLAVRVNGSETIALLDTGAPQSALTLRVARAAGIQDSELTPYGRVAGIGRGHARSWSAPVASFELRGEKIANNRLQIDEVDSPDDGAILGLDYFVSHRIYVSKQQRKVYITWNGGPAFALARNAPGDYDMRYAAVPTAVEADDADTFASRGAAEIEAGDLTHALADLNRACELAPEVARHFLDRARLHMTMRAPKPALADLDTALRLDPTLAEARFRRAQVRMVVSDRAGAQDDLAELDRQLPAASTVRADMAEAWSILARPPEALRQFDLWIASHPQDGRRAAVLDARCRLRTRFALDLPLALADCEQAVALDAGAGGYRDTLGWTLLRLGDPARAKAAFDDALRLQPMPISLYGRGLAEIRLDDRAHGDADLAQARTLRPAIDDEVRQRGFAPAAKP